MPLAPGTRLGPYEVISPLGAGGMGEVYRARDSQLGRAVAIKAMPDAFAADPDRLARFEREAKLLASLSHPNIAGIHGLVEEGGRRYLALELVEGESLAARLSRGAMPLEEALPVCEQIAAALETAHDAGIVHRDLKPANVMLREDGSVKVLDFGLAKGPTAEPAPDMTQSPTLTSPMTSPGMILGTAAYMSPEQARGRTVDRRADAWGWGCVLYECLTGKRAFPGEDISETLAAILKDTPDWSALPPDTPDRVRELLARCLVKDPRERQRDLGDARLELAAARRAGPQARLAARVTRALPVPALAVAALLALLAGALVGAWIVTARRAPAPTRRYQIIPPDQGAGLLYGGEYALSPDGRMLLAGIADSSGLSALWVRSLETGEWRRLEGTENASFPFWSPDSRDIGYFTQRRLLRVPAAGGQPQDLCAVNEGRGGAWSRTHEIVFAASLFGPLERVPETGGTPVPIAHLPGLDGERFPQFLPDGIHYLYMATRRAAQQNCVFGASMRDTVRTELVTNADAMNFRPPDQLLFMRGRTVLGQRIDPVRLAARGAPSVRDEHPSQTAQISLAPVFSFAGDGTMLFATADRRSTDAYWYGRDGRVLGSLPLGLPGIVSGSLSPDGTRLAASADVDGPSLFVFDLVHGGRVVLPGTEKFTGSAAWSADGSRVGGALRADSLTILAAFDAGGSGRCDTLDVRGMMTAGSLPLNFFRDWSRDGRRILLGQTSTGRGWDVFDKDLGVPGPPRVLASTAGYEGDARFSRDGRWFAYMSDFPGQAEIFVDRYPQAGDAKRLSYSGVFLGSGPNRVVWWRADDREIEYLGADGRTVWAAPVQTAPTLELGKPVPLFVAPPGTMGVEASPDGQRFLVFLPHGPFVNSFTVVTGGRASPREAR